MVSNANMIWIFVIKFISKLKKENSIAFTFSPYFGGEFDLSSVIAFWTVHVGKHFDWLNFHLASGAQLLL